MHVGLSSLYNVWQGQEVKAHQLKVHLTLLASPWGKSILKTTKIRKYCKNVNESDSAMPKKLLFESIRRYIKMAFLSTLIFKIYTYLHAKPSVFWCGIYRQRKRKNKYLGTKKSSFKRIIRKMMQYDCIDWICLSSTPSS